MAKEQRKTNHSETTYIVGSPDRHTTYLIKDGSVVLDKLPQASKPKEPEPEPRALPEGATPPMDIPTPNRYVPLTGEKLNWGGVFYNDTPIDYQLPIRQITPLNENEISQAVGLLGLGDTEDASTDCNIFVFD